ncbi:MAG: hypothetical protein WCP08_07600 [Prolixibacteraceae bacterium]
MQATVSAHYQSKIADLKIYLQSVRRILSRLYLIRLVTFLAFVAFLVLYIRSDNNFGFLLLSLLSVVAFLLAVKLDMKYAFRERYTSNQLQINKNELKILDHQYADRETGAAYSYLNPHLAADFDLFGSGSLFQYLNRCSTLGGKLKLAEALCLSRQDETLIREKQQAIGELVEKNEFVAGFQAHGMFITEKGNELESIETWLSQPDEKSPLLNALCYVIPVLNICWIALVITGTFTSGSLWIPILASLSITGSQLKTINRAHSLLSKTAGTLKSYTTNIRLMETEQFRSVYLTRLQQKLSGKGTKAGDSLTSLFKLLNSFDLRLNILVSVFLNILFLYDIQVWLRLGKWKVRNKTAVAGWFEALSELDALASFSIYAFNNREDVTYPEVAEDEFTLEATEMGHPLLHPATRVCNTVGLSGAPRILIITGANMAGKSTFLRTLSSNLILAMNGAPVCAKAFRFTPCDLLSSIKIQDSLSNNESYFYAELVRIREIIEHLQIHPRTLVVLDEILRGTNTRDKQTGSRGLLEKLISLNAVVLIATHDLTLGELETTYPGTVLNQCFEVELTGDQLIFDYKLKPGISQKLNASYLMRKMGIIE